MKTIIYPRGGGKTTELIKQSAQNMYYIVCATRQQAAYIFEMSFHLKLDIPLPITFEDFDNRDYCSKNIKGFLFDDLDDYIQSKTRVPIKSITITSS